MTWTLAQASDSDRAEIGGLRHEIYARELGQHAINAAQRLADELDGCSIVVAAKRGSQIGGFVSITPPSAPSYSIEKYFERGTLPFAFDDRLYEIRLLTVIEEYRGGELSLLLMHAAFRWVEAHGGKHIMAIGRREVVELYRSVGMRPLGQSTQSGAVTYDLMVGSVPAMREKAKASAGLFERLERKTDWRFGFAFRPPAPCFHGGAFFGAIGEQFDHLERSQTIINADVLDAWYPPAPGVLRALRQYLPWLLRTSPPTQGAGLIEVIAAARGIAPENILPGAGSSDLIFRALRHWLTPGSRALILDPTYGEYAHVLESVIGCAVDRLALSAEESFDLDPSKLTAAFARGYDLIVIVNPNSPTGRHLPGAALERALQSVPPQTRVWVDETYIEFAGAAQSIERWAARSENVIVCKSMSKAYALSGARVAYLCAGQHQLEALRAITPPWVVSLPAQVAAVAALQDPAYYQARYRETELAREELAHALAALGWEVLPGVANFILGRLPADGLGAATLVQRCRAHGLYLRDAATTSVQLRDRWVRIAVKDSATNRRIREILSEVMLNASASAPAGSRKAGCIKSGQKHKLHA